MISKGKSDCHVSNDKYREGWERVFGKKENDRMHCPIFGKHRASKSTLVAYLGRDENQVWCDCGWTGKAYELGEGGR